MTDIGTRQLQTTAIPAWVVHEPYDSTAHSDDTFVKNGISVLLRDTQTDITDRAKAVHIRLVYRIVTQAGAENAARFSSSFDPALQHMDIHNIRVIRGSESIEHARVEDFDLIRREQNLERRMLDGRLTASLIIPDVRPGDILEQSWTIYGETSILRDFHSEWIPFESGEPIQEIRYRLRSPEARPIVVKNFGAPVEFSMQESGGIVDRRWSAKGCLPAKFEALIPPWRALARSIQISEDRGWPAVAALFAPLFQDSSFPDEMREEAEAIKARNPGSAEGRMLDILRIVRQRLRYFALSLGEGGLVPRSIQAIWSTGYGDCKDASRLFVALAKLADIEAVPALVATAYGPAIGDWLSSPTIFNHCIIRARADGKTYWLDPTRRAREYSVGELFNPHLGYALPLTATNAQLELMPASAPKLLLYKSEKLKFGPKVSSPATLEVRIKYHSHNADWIRELIANQGMNAVASQLKDRYQQNWAKITEGTPLQIEESQDENIVTLIAAFTITEAWQKTIPKKATCTIRESDIRFNLGELNTDGDRHNDVYLGLPRILRHRLEIQMPKNWEITSVQRDERIHGLKYWKNISRPERRRVILEQELTVSATTCPPGEADRYSAIVHGIAERSAFTLSSPIFRDRFKITAAWPRHWRKYYLIAYAIIVLLWLLGTMHS